MELSQSLLEAGLLSFLSLLLLTSSPAAAQHAGHNGPRHHAHLPRMQPAQQKLQSLLQEPALGRTANAMAAEATALTGLLPACVPKYETDLVIPAPMPVSLVPLRKKGKLRRGKGSSSYDGSEEGVKVDQYELPLHLQPSNNKDLTELQREKLRLTFSANEEYYQQKHASAAPHQSAPAPGPALGTQAAQKDAPAAEKAPKPQSAFHSYDVRVRQIQQNVLPPTPTANPRCPASFASTTVLAYSPANIAGQPFHNWPGFTIEAQRNIPTHIRWINDLKDASGAYLPHILRDSIDQTIHWANPAALGGSVDSNPCHACSMMGPFTCNTNQACETAATSTYTGPVPTVTHVHGQNAVPDYSDGYPEAWFLPDANDLGLFTPYSVANEGKTWSPGSSTGIYPNTQRPTQLWYHDHTVGLTRTNVFAGMAGMYFIRDKFPSIANGPELPGLPYPAYDSIIPLELVRELPLTIQDRSFTSDSQLWYPVAAHPEGKALPEGPLHPRWVPEYAATLEDPENSDDINYLMWTVNGRTYPRQTVYPDAYRLRILNGCNARTVQLRFARSTKAAINPLLTADTSSRLPFWVVGNDDGFWPILSSPMISLQMGPAERYDVVVDFSGMAPGEFAFLLNNGPETDTAIYDGTNNGVGLTEATAQIMRFDVSPLPVGQVARPFTLARQKVLNKALIADYAATVKPIVPRATARQVTLMEMLDSDDFPIAPMLGTGTSNANGLNVATPQMWMDRVTADSPSDAVSVWDIINLSADSHPIHLHNVDFEYLGCFALLLDPDNPNSYTKTSTPVPNADLDPLLVVPCPVTLNPTGKCAVRKDTQLVLPATYTRIAFHAPARSGLYVWHCHLIEHEDNEMMVPHCFGTVKYINPMTGLPMCPPGPNGPRDTNKPTTHSHPKTTPKAKA